MAALSEKSQDIIDAFSKQPGVSASHVQALTDAIEASASLVDQFNSAVANGHLTEVIPLNNPNAAGEYSYPQMRIPLSSLIAGQETELTFVLGHELQHGFNHAATQQAYQDFNDAVVSKSIETATPRDYTDATAALITANRRDEAGSEIAGWNALVSRLKSENPNPTLQDIFNSNWRASDFIDVGGSPTTYTR